MGTLGWDEFDFLGDYDDDLTVWKSGPFSINRYNREDEHYDLYIEGENNVVWVSTFDKLSQAQDVAQAILTACEAQGLEL
jgi:uncharacterized phage-associated protein